MKKVLKATSKFSNNGKISKFTENFARDFLPTIEKWNWRLIA